MAATPSSDISPDLVVIVPGIMGSRLRDRKASEERGKDVILWGLNAGWYAKAWLLDSPWEKLALDDDERNGRFGRVEADQVLGVGAMAPVLGGFEPYGNLLRGLVATVPAGALVKFPYDWRLPVTYNAGLLAKTLVDEFDRWRADPACVEAQRRSGRDAQVVVVAHSMGGLVYRAIVGDPDLRSATANVRAVLTLGTPFSGAPKAVLTLGLGEGGPFPLPKGRLRRMARTLPGLYDLLPLYRCIEQGDDVRLLTAEDISGIDGDADLARTALETQSRLRNVSLASEGVRHFCYIGGFQPTQASLEFASGTVRGLEHSFAIDDHGRIRVDDGRPLRVVQWGDTTVPLNSAQIAGGSGFTVIAQKHGSMAKVSEAVTQAKAILLGQTETRQYVLGDTEFGFDCPEIIPVDQPQWVRTVEVELGSAAGTVQMLDDAGLVIRDEHLVFTQRDGEVGTEVRVPAPGAYRIKMESGGGSAVTQLVLALPTE